MSLHTTSRLRTTAVSTLAALALVGAAAPANAVAPGGPDRSFGQRGTVTTEVGGDDVAQDVVVQPNGKIVVVGSSDGKVVVARYKPDGRPDRSFSGDGRVVTDLGVPGGYGGQAVALQADGKIVVGGSNGDYAMAVLRYTPTGQLDRTFSGDGIFLRDNEEDHNSGTDDLLIQPNGKIVALGWDLVRIKPGGVLDPKFTPVDVTSEGQGYRRVARLSTGDYLLASSSDCNTAELNRFSASTGEQVASWDQHTGRPAGAAAVGLHVLAQDRTLVVSDGASTADCNHVHGITLERYLPTGRPDGSFGPGGARFVGSGRFPAGVGDISPVNSAIGPGGQIVVVGAHYVARFTKAGKLDRSFGGGIVGLGPVSGKAVVVQPDQKIVVAGGSGSDLAVRRYQGR